MNREEALSILKNVHSYIAWDRLNDVPYIDETTIALNGHFNQEELEAVLFFLREQNGLQQS